MTVSRVGAICALALRFTSVVAQSSSSAPFANSSTSSSTVSSSASASASSASPSLSRTACTGCTVTASEQFLTYTGEVSTVDHIVTATVVPYVTQNDKGENVTQLVTIAQDSANSTGLYTGLPTFAPLTWVHNEVTLTYPTTYISFFGLAGGFITSAPSVTPTGSGPSCEEDSQPIDLPLDSEPHMILPVNVPDTTQSISAPPAFIAYLDSLPAVQTQFNSTGLAKCSWTKPLVTTSFFGVGGTAAPVVKVSKASLTEVTVNPVFAGNTAGPTVSVMNASPGQEAQQNNLGDVIASILGQGISAGAPSPPGAIPGIPTQTGGAPDRPLASGRPGPAPTVAPPNGNGPSSNLPGSGGSGSGGNSGPSFVLPNSATLFQGQTSVINGVTFAVPSGGSAIVVASGGISATATGGVGGYIASGLGYTGAQATTNAAWRGVHDMRVMGGVVAAGLIGVGLL